MKAAADLCIVASTCARCAPVARFAIGRMDEEWPGHPPVFVCGLDGGEGLPLRDDPADWMAVMHSAAWDLLAQGFRRCYLVLDDLPPVGPCAAAYLNTTLPDQAAELGAVVIGLLGWGQRRPIEGEDMGARWQHLSRNSPDYRWKFSLHPGLWDLDALARLLRARMELYPRGQRTPWNFERHRDAADGPVPAEMLAATYRVHGESVVGIRPGDRIRQAGLLGFDLWRFVLRAVAGQPARDRFDRDGLWLYHFYNGPYPLFWSGAMRQGRPGKEFLDFVRRTRRRELAAAWEAARRQLS